MVYIWPWPKGTRISQNFGSSPGGVNPAGGHTGIDAALPVGTPLRAPADGVIEWADWCTDPTGSDNPWLLTNGGGIVVVLNCGAGKPNFLLAHLSRTDLNKGDRVKQGQVIGFSGNTGAWTTGPHCHFEAMADGYNIRSSTYGRTNPGLFCTSYWEDLVSVAPQGNVTVPLKPNERKAGASPVNQRSAPKVSAPIVRVIPAGSKEVWLGYVRGDSVTAGGRTSNLWFKDALGYASILFFDPYGTAGLADLTPKPTAPAPTPTTPEYDFVLDFQVINGVKVEKFPAHWDNYGTEFPAKPAKAVLHWWGDPAIKPGIAGLIADFSVNSTGKSAHFGVSDTRIIQFVSLADRAFHAGAGGNDWVGIEVDPMVLEKDADGKPTARALKIRANVIALLTLLKTKYGYELPLTLHKNVPGAATSCSGLVLADFALPVPPVTPPTIPTVPTAPVDDIGTLRRFFEWLINLFMNRNK